MPSFPTQNDTPQAVQAVGTNTDRSYKSPPRKLLRFFARSRDQWKEKCLEAKALVKGLKHRMRFLEQSKNHWKSRVHVLEGELTRMRLHTQAMQEEIDALKKR